MPRSTPSILRSSDWIESYITALQSSGLSSEYRQSESGASEGTWSLPDVKDRQAPPHDDTSANYRVARFYVGQVHMCWNDQKLFLSTLFTAGIYNPQLQTLKLAAHDDAALHHAWRKAQVSGDLRSAHIAWRMWFMRMRDARRLPKDQLWQFETEHVESESEEEDMDVLQQEREASESAEQEDSSSATEAGYDGEGASGPESNVGLYIVLLSVHGLVRGHEMQLGRDPDTGGQVKYVVEYARALAAQSSVHRVDLLTRRTTDPEVDDSYSVREEVLSQPSDGYHASSAHGGAYIVRLDAGPTEHYLAKEALWPYMREFADRAIDHVRTTLDKVAFAGRPCKLHLVHGHYSEAGEIASLIASVLDAPVCFTGHSLGRNKLHHLMDAKNMTEAEVDQKYRIFRRIEAEERALDAAEMVVTSTRQEVEGQWGLYDGWDQRLANALQKSTNTPGRYMPKMHVNPPGLDFASTAQQSGKDDEQGEKTMTHSRSESDFYGATPPEQVKPPIWRSIERFLDNPRKPAILALARPEAKKNLTTVVKAFGESQMLRNIANVVLIMGNRDDINDLAPGSQDVIKEVLTTIDRYDLYGHVAIPKHHAQDDIPDIYRYALSTRGVFINAAFQEPFGLTLIEACAYGVPVVATKHGGPVEIHRTLKNGVLIEPTNTEEIINALLTLVTDRQTWEQKRHNGLSNIHKYSWSAHCQRHLSALAEAAGKRRKRQKNEGNEDSRRMAGNISMSKTGSFEHLQDVMGAFVAAALEEDNERTLSQVSQSAHVPAKERISAPYTRVVSVSVDTTSPQSGAKVVKKVLETKSNDVAVGVVALDGRDNVRRVLKEHGVSEELLAFMVTDTGSAVYFQWGDKLVYSEEWQRKVKFRWHADTVRKAIMRASGNRHAVTTQSKPQSTIEEELQDLMEADHPGVKPAKGRFEERADSSNNHLKFELVELEGAEPEAGNIRRWLRKKGIRCNLFHAKGDNTLRAVPLRASRWLALRYVVGLFGLTMDERVLTICTPFAGDDDRADLLEGANKKAVVPSMEAKESETILHDHAKSSYTDYSLVEKADGLDQLAAIVREHCKSH